MRFPKNLFPNKLLELSPRMFVDLLRKVDPIILEIGCNDGSHTIGFLQAFPKSRLFCFEPDRRAINRFTHKINDPRAVLHPYAIGSVDGVTRFFQSGGNPLAHPDPQFPADWDLSGSIYPPLNHLLKVPGVTFSNQEEVPIRRLDSVVRDLGIERVDLIWADVQGAEADLISGGRQTLKKTRFLYTEYSDNELYAGQINLSQLRALLPEFKLVKKFPNDVLFENKEFSN